MSTRYLLDLHPSPPNHSRGIFLLAALALFVVHRPAFAIDQLAYSFESDLQGFHNNGGGTTVTQDTIGATNGTNSMKVSVVAGATFVERRLRL